MYIQGESSNFARKGRKSSIIARHEKTDARRNSNFARFEKMDARRAIKFARFGKADARKCQKQGGNLALYARNASNFLKRKNGDSILQYHFENMVADYNINDSRLQYHFFETRKW